MLVLLLGMLADVGPAAAARKASIVVEAETGRVLSQSNADRHRHPASLTKVMTLYMAFEALDQGRLRMNQKLKVSRRAARQPRSKLGLRAGTRITVKNAIMALITKSANDAATVIAEALGGTESKFARRMTIKARALGMRNTTYRNASGLHNRAQKTTARDQAVLGIALMRDFPHYYKLFNTRSFTYKGRRHRNHNRLLGKYPGTDGIKTGYIRASGFNVLTSTVRGGRRLVGVVMGGRSAARRDRQMMRIMNTAYAKRGGRGGALVAKLSPRMPRTTLRPRLQPGSELVLTLNEPTTETASTTAAANTTAKSNSGLGVTYNPPPTVVARSTDRVILQGPMREPASRGSFGSREDGRDQVLRLPNPVPRPGSRPASIDGAPQLKPGVSVGWIKQSPKMRPGSDYEQVTMAPAPTVVASLANPPVAPPPATDATTSTIRPKGWAIQVGAFRAKKEATRAAKWAKNRVPDLLNDAQTSIEPAHTDIGRFYRARLYGMTSKRQADQACKRLHKAKMPCLAMQAPSCSETNSAAPYC